jgi:sigma-B regulation protein RsbU (phosphoserine phosphatase)
MIADSGRSMDIVTAWIGFLDVSTGELTHADGGHPPALLLRADSREVERLGVTGPLLGAVEDAEYDEECISIMSGDVVLLYTDGVTEAREGNRFFGEGRVRRALHYGGSADDVSQRLHSALDRFVRGDLRDDAAVLVLKIRPQNEESER